MSNEKLNITNSNIQRPFYERRIRVSNQDGLYPAQERKLFKIINEGKQALLQIETEGMSTSLQEKINEAENAKKQIIESHYIFVKRMVNDIIGHLDNDAVHEGVLGLYEALEKFDSEHGSKFVSYAWEFVRGRIKSYKAAKKSPVKFSKYNYDKLQQLKDIEDEYIYEHKCKPTNFYIEENCDLSQNQYNNVFLHAKWSSFDAPIMDDENEVDLYSFVSDDNANTERTASSNIMFEEVLGVMDNLDELEKQVICMNYGVCGYSEASVKEIASALDISSAKVYKIRNDALSKLNMKLSA